MTKLDPVRIRVKNFQSVEDVDFEVRGFTCITGKTNIGKSAVMRAVSSAILNDPVVGKVRKGSQFSTVEISSSGWGFKWEKGERGVNRYTIGDKVYDKIGQRQLDEIVAMGFGSVKVGDHEIQPWWASQFFPLFLLDKSGPQVTDFISEVSRLTVLQDAIVIAARGKRQASDEAKVKAEESSRLKDRVSKVAGLDPLIKLRSELDDQADSIRSYEERLSAGESLHRRMEESASKIRSLSGVTSVRVPKEDLGPAVEALSSMYGHWRSLESCAHRVISLRDVSKIPPLNPPDDEHDRLMSLSRFAKIGALRKSVDAMKGVSGVSVPDPSGAKDALDRLTALSPHQALIGRLRISVAALSAVVSVPDDPDGVLEAKDAIVRMEEASRLSAEIKSLESKIRSLEKDLKAVDKDLSSIPSCPTCSRPVSPGSPGHSHA